MNNNENLNSIINAAEMCLNCSKKPCSINGCPMNTNIPEFISCVKNSNFEEAYRILMENNIFSKICSTICPQNEQCEGSCVKNKIGAPVKIKEIEKFVNDKALKNNIEFNPRIEKENGKKVAIIGSGPAGLECAYELIKAGCSVDVYEKEERIGGILNYGIPDFRLGKKALKDLFDFLQNLGVCFYFQMELGKDIFIESLKQEYDFIFIGIGAEISGKYLLSSEQLKNVYDFDDFLKMYNYGKYIENLGIVSVIGGGNVAMDVARTAIRMGAEKVKILYRRDRAHMPASGNELDDALNEGVEFKELVRVESANYEDIVVKKHECTDGVCALKNEVLPEKKIVSLNCVKTQIVNNKAEDTEEKFLETTNTVVFAIGQKPNKNLLESQGIELNEYGFIKIDENGETNLENVYAGGDLTESKFSVCKALSAGKRAALGIINKI